MTIGLEILIILLLIVLNGLFSMSELALVSARRARLAGLERKGVTGAATARALADDPQRFLPTVQVGITLVSVLTGVFGGARIAGDVATWLAAFPATASVRRDACRWPLWSCVTTYLTLVLGRTGAEATRAARSPEQIAAMWSPGRSPGSVASSSAPRLAAGEVLRRRAGAVRPAPRAARRQ